MMTNGIRQNAATRKNVLVQSEIIIFDLDALASHRDAKGCRLWALGCRFKHTDKMPMRKTGTMILAMGVNIFRFPTVYSPQPSV